ncbi:hypothetical protein IFM89_039030 [Coptis chinensis]|uniref:NAD-dependent epimerase/dehydratase domain-containing protein n=1 Tax=Coptis chinensis TaxID=261450 RepID=A0A835ILJ1_9MAGN|nr:hypothetical protein IFM89_039030 [Coptis chinensis]
MINMAVEGTLGILKACLNSKTVKKVVLTSSIAAVVFNNSGLEEFNENSWTDVELCRSTKVAGSSYSIPKTLAEQTALNFGEEHGLDVVAINPSVVVGPFICPHFPASNYIALSLYMGNRDGYKYLTRAQFVHIDDVVSGHLYLFESPNAKGRYICSSVNTTFDQLVKFHSDRYPEIEMPLDFFKGMDINPFCFSSKKLLDLGFKFKYSLEEMYDGAIQSCYEKGFL